jgi:hypothetical protein
MVQNQFPKRCVVISISDCVCVLLCVCVYLYWYYFGPPCVMWSVSSCVTNCHLGFSLASSVSGCVWVCVCLGLYAIVVFPRFFNSCEVCSGWVTYCHWCLTCFKGLCVYAPR